MKRYRVEKYGDHECRIYFNYRDLRQKYAKEVFNKDKNTANAAWKLSHTLDRWAHQMRVVNLKEANGEEEEKMV